MFWACLWTISKFFLDLHDFAWIHGLCNGGLSWTHWHNVQFGLPFSVKVYLKLLDMITDCWVSVMDFFWITTHSKGQKARLSEVQKWSKTIMKKLTLIYSQGQICRQCCVHFWVKWQHEICLLRSSFISGYRGTSFRYKQGCILLKVLFSPN